MFFLFFFFLFFSAWYGVQPGSMALDALRTPSTNCGQIILVFTLSAATVAGAVSAPGIPAGR